MGLADVTHCDPCLDYGPPKPPFFVSSHDEGDRRKLRYNKEPPSLTRPPKHGHGVSRGSLSSHAFRGSSQYNTLYSALDSIL